MIWKKFKAMGSEIIISADLETGKEGMLDRAELAVLDFEKRFSRFIDANELARLNDQSGQSYPASEMMIELLIKAKDLYNATGGIFDPTIIGSLEAIGYDKSFETINNVDGPNKDDIDMAAILNINSLRPRMESLTISGQTVSRPKNFRLDLGGIGKGYIIDHLANNIFSGINNFWISAGGDLVVKGSAENKSGWEIGVQDPDHPELDRYFIKTKGEKLAVATSGVIKRKGQSRDFAWHHIIDPRTGLPASNNILSVTAMSFSAVFSDVLAKTVLILGPEDGMEFIEKRNKTACIIFLKDRKTILSGNIFKYIDYEKA